jgi:para-nitrobenzyl esterase
MKQFNLLACLILLSLSAMSQRYLTPQFDSVQVVPDIQYGFNYNYKGDSTQLFLDLYFPYEDTASKRPMVVLAHGGSFVQGNRKSTDMVAICKALASRGYVVASIQYRLGVSLSSGNTLEKEFQQAVWRGAQDGRAAIRFLRKHIAEGNAWKLDDNHFYSGGVSAGGVLALQAECLDLPSEVASINLDTIALGGIEGNSGNAGYNWRVKGIVNLCGALGNVSWINNNTNISLCHMHGDLDRTVPYKTDYFKFLNSPVALLQGSFSVDSAAKMQGMNSRLYTFNGADHVPFAGLTDVHQKYMDTVVNYVSAYLYRFVSGIIPASLNEQTQEQASFRVYPNPAKNQLMVTRLKLGSTLHIMNLNGQLMFQAEVEGPQQVLDIASLPKGVYIVRGEMPSGALVQTKLVVE